MNSVNLVRRPTLLELSGCCVMPVNVYATCMCKQVCMCRREDICADINLVWVHSVKRASKSTCSCCKPSQLY